VSLPLVGPEVHGTSRQISTCRMTNSGLEQIQILSAAHLAGFEVSLPHSWWKSGRVLGALGSER
jgi:hypothetical protein